MSAPAAARVLRLASRSSARSFARLQHSGRSQAPALRAGLTHTQLRGTRCFTCSTRSYAGMMPETADPQPPKGVEEHQVTQPTEINDEDYHARADEYVDAVREKAEAIQETREDVEVEYSAGVLSITFPPNGTYIINKQPVNKQIWLSSPTTGPKRFDWVLVGEGHHQKEGGGVGDWMYLRDNSSLTDILSKELGITVDLHGHEESMKQSRDPTE